MNYEKKKVLVVGMARSGVAAAQLLRGQGLDYDRLYALMREHHFVLPRQEQETALPRVEDLLGPLGEQLTRLYGDAQAPTQFYS